MRFIPLTLLRLAPCRCCRSNRVHHRHPGSRWRVGDGGAATSAVLSDAEGVAVDSMDNLYIADSKDHLIRKIATAGAVSTVAGDGSPGLRGDGGPATAARRNTPSESP
jgi:hypothetical protein